MSISDVIGNKIKNAIETVAEYNRTQAELTRLRIILKGETEKLNRAYIELGKEYFNIIKDNESDEHKDLIDTIDSAKEKIEKTRERYRSVKESDAKKSDTCDDSEPCCDCTEQECCNEERPEDDLDVCPDEQKHEPCNKTKSTRKTIKTVIKKAEAKAQEKTDALKDASDALEDAAQKLKENINDAADAADEKIIENGEKIVSEIFDDKTDADDEAADELF